MTELNGNEVKREGKIGNNRRGRDANVCGTMEHGDADFAAEKQRCNAIFNGNNANTDPPCLIIFALFRRCLDMRSRLNRSVPVFIRVSACFPAGREKSRRSNNADPRTHGNDDGQTLRRSVSLHGVETIR